MGARFRSRWQKIRKPLEIAVVSTLPVIVVVLFVLIILGYIFHWDWTGLNGYNNVLTATEITASPQKITRTIAYQPGKTLWDWLQLLIIPAVLAVGGYVFNYTISKNEQQSTQVRDQTERDIAADNQREAALQAYIDKMSELLLAQNLRNASKDGDRQNIAGVRTLLDSRGIPIRSGPSGPSEAQKIGRIRTLTVLRRLDAERKGSVLRFLHESGLIYKDKPIIDLTGADLCGADLSGAGLHHADLSEANLNDAILDEAYLMLANLGSANLSNAYLGLAKLVGAYLGRANLIGAKLFCADLTGANLIGAKLSNANLSWADLRGADLEGADLRLADLHKADLRDAILYDADLRGAKVTQEQLEKAKSLEGATMPDGSKHS